MSADPRPWRYEFARKTKADGHGANCEDGAPTLCDSIAAAFPAPRVWRANPNGTVVSFADELTGAEKTTLDGIVAAWDPDSVEE